MGQKIQRHFEISYLDEMGFQHLGVFCIVFMGQNPENHRKLFYQRKAFSYTKTRVLKIREEKGRERNYTERYGTTRNGTERNGTERNGTE